MTLYTSIYALALFAIAATLLMAPSIDVLGMLQMRSIERWFSCMQLFTIFVIWYLMTIWGAGSAYAGGTFLPSMLVTINVCMFLIILIVVYIMEL